MARRTFLGSTFLCISASRSRVLRCAGAAFVASVTCAAAATAQAPGHCKAFGDSITVGVGDDPERSAPGYPPRLEELVPGLYVDNRGVGGERTTEGLARIDDVLAELGDCLLLMEGTNDVSRGISPETTLFNLDEMAARAEAVGWTAYHATLIPRLPNARVDPNNWHNQDLVQSIRRLAALAGRGLVDPFETFTKQRRLFHALYYGGAEDTVGHPNGDGYGLLATVFADVLLALDTAPPVPTQVIPAHGAEEVPAASALEIEVRDFGSAIDADSVMLLVDGEPAPAPEVDDDLRWLQWSFSPGEELDGVVTVTLRAADAEGNLYDRMVARFLVEGAVLSPGDVDRDGRVDGRDLVFLGLAFGAEQTSRRFDADADLDGSGQVDGEDLAILAANFGAGS